MENYKIKFIIGVPNFWNSDNTLKLRAIIKDEFKGGRNKWDLQCTEYAHYKIKQNGIDIKWPVRYGRHGGKWADIFIKYKLYKVTDVPTAGCAMSFRESLKGAAYETGHVAYVEKVWPDGSIYLSEANWPGKGKYNERKLTKAVWCNKYKARFISFS